MWSCLPFAFLSWADKNRLLRASAGQDRVVQPRESVVLSGFESKGHEIEYLWEQVSGGQTAVLEVCDFSYHGSIFVLVERQELLMDFNGLLTLLNSIPHFVNSLRSHITCTTCSQYLTHFKHSCGYGYWSVSISFRKPILKMKWRCLACLLECISSSSPSQTTLASLTQQLSLSWSLHLSSHTVSICLNTNLL